MEPKYKRSKVFKDTANFKLKGTTFDAHHLDQFVQFGCKSVCKESMIKINMNFPNFICLLVTLLLIILIISEIVIKPTPMTTKNAFNPKREHRREIYNNLRYLEIFIFQARPSFRESPKRYAKTG